MHLGDAHDIIESDLGFELLRSIYYSLLISVCRTFHYGINIIIIVIIIISIIIMFISPVQLLWMLVKYDIMSSYTKSVLLQ